MSEQVAGAGNAELRLDRGYPGARTRQNRLCGPNPVEVGRDVWLERMVSGWRHPYPVELEAFARRLYYVLMTVMGRIECTPHETDPQALAGAWKTNRLS